MYDQPTAVVAQTDVTLLRELGRATQPCLLLYSGAEAGQRFDLEPGAQIVGRVSHAPVRIEGSGVSRQHAELLVGAGTVLLHDLGSSNGTLVNEQRIQQPTALKDGDLIRLGAVVLRFHTHNSVDLLLHDRIYRQATVDPSTGAFNRKFLFESLRRAFAKARRNGTPLSVICYDLDHFKQVNDAFGHAAGDIVLRVTTTVALAELRDSDLLARVGGEEFTLLLDNTPAVGAMELAERIRAEMAQFPIELPDPAARHSTKPAEHRQTVSLGVAELKPEMADEHALLQAGERALYLAKRRGRNQVAL